MIATKCPSQGSADTSSSDPLEYVSPSRLKNYLTCPLRFFFEKVLQIPKPGSAALHLGRAVHSALQAFNKARWRELPYSETSILEVYHAAFQNEDPERIVAWESAKKRDEVEARGAAVVSAFMQSGTHATESKPAGVEVTLRTARPDLPIPLLGVVDLVKADGTPVDYKTIGSSPVLELESWLHEIQLVTYALLVEDSTDQPIPGCELVFLVKTKKPKVVVHRLAPPDEIKLMRFRSLVETYVAGIERGDYYPRPGQQCAWCAYRRECSGWKGGSP